MRLRDLLGRPAPALSTTHPAHRTLPRPSTSLWDVRVEEYPGQTISPWGVALVLRCAQCDRPVTTIAPGDVLGIIVGLIEAHQAECRPTEGAPA